MRKLAKRYKQIVDRPFQKISFISTIGLLLLTIVFSCGPRSGIHNDEKKTDDVNISGNANETKQIDVSYSEKGGKLYKQNCAVCHAKFEDHVIVGPPLKGIADRLPQPAEEWFVKYTINNEKVFASGDAYAAKLKAEYKDKPMTVFEGVLSEDDVREIYTYLTGQPKHPVP
jgi:cytochrome c2